MGLEDSGAEGGSDIADLSSDHEDVDPSFHLVSMLDSWPKGLSKHGGWQCIGVSCSMISGDCPGSQASGDMDLLGFPH